MAFEFDAFNELAFQVFNLVSITYPLAMPAAPYRFRAMTLMQNFQVAVNKSPFTGQSQTYEHQGSSWSAKIDFPSLTRAQAAPWIAFLAALNGRSGTFLFGPPNWPAPLGNAGGSPVVNGGSQVGKTLLISGLTGTLKAGDYFHLGSGITQRLYMNLTDNTGATALDIFPRLRESPSNGTPLTLANPQGVFRLDSNQNAWVISVDQRYALSFSAEEAF